MRAVRRPGELGIGDRVEFAGRAHTVISVSGTVIRLAGRDGQVTGIAMSELLSADGFALVDTRPRAPVPEAALLNDLPEEAVARALWWQRQIVEVLRGVPPDAEPGALPRPEYDPSAVSLTRREQAKAVELTAAGFPVTASAVKQRRRRYQERGLLGMVDHRVSKRLPPHGRADPAVAGAMRQAIAETAGDSTRTAAFVLRRTRQILAASDEQAVPEMPSERTLYRLFGRLQAGKHATGSARTRRSLAARPDAPFGRREANAPGEVMEIDSTPLDVLVRLADGVVGRVELTALVDVATRTVTAAVLRPTTKAPDASVLLARTVTPEPMRPGWPQAMAMAESALPFRRLPGIDERLEHAAARPVIIPSTIVVDHGKVFVSVSFMASCEFLGINVQPARKATGTDKPHIERTLGSVASLFAQYVAGYTGRSPEYRGRRAEDAAVWPLPELQDLLDQWIIACWQNRPHDGLRDPLLPGREFTPNEKYAALVETAGYLPLALSADDYVELLPACWRVINAYGVKLSRRVYDGPGLNRFRLQHSGVAARDGQWEVHYDPYDVSRIWVRDHWGGGWITVFWTQLHRVAAPFGELAWDHARKQMPHASETELADAVRGPAHPRWAGSRRPGPAAEHAGPARGRPDRGCPGQPRSLRAARHGRRPVRTRGRSRRPGRGSGRGGHPDRPDADLRSVPGSREMVVTPAECRTDPAVQLTTLPGWRHFVAAVPSIPELFTQAGWLGLDAGKRAAHDEERLEHHSRLVVVQTPAIARIVKRGGDLIRMNRAAFYGRSGLMVSGPARTGKTTAITQLGKTAEVMHRRRHPRARDDIPVIYITVPPAATGKMIAMELARFLGLPVSRRANITDVIEPACGVCLDAHVTLILVDELHNLDMGTRAGAEASDTLKYFSERLPATFVYAGIGLDRGALLAGPRGAQVAGRFTLIPTSAFLPGQEWVTLVAALDSSLRLYHHRGGELAKLAGYLHRRTRGVIGSLLWLVRDAANQAIIDGTEKITRKSLDVIAVDMTAQAPAAQKQARKP